LVEKVALIVVDGVSAGVYARNGSVCKNLPSLFSAAVPVQFPGMCFDLTSHMFYRKDLLMPLSDFYSQRGGFCRGLYCKRR
jgi:hypothetical protein